MLKAALFSLALVVGVATLSNTARASDFTQYETFAVKNTTNETIRYEVRWGKNEWKSYTLNPGVVRWHYHRDDLDGPIPEPRLRYHAGGTYDNPIVITHVMGTEIVDQPKSVKPHQFRLNGSGQLQLRFIAPSQGEPRTQPNPVPDLVIR